MEIFKNILTITGIQVLAIIPTALIRVPLGRTIESLFPHRGLELLFIIVTLYVSFYFMVSLVGANAIFRNSFKKLMVLFSIPHLLYFCTRDLLGESSLLLLVVPVLIMPYMLLVDFSAKKDL